MGKLVDLDVIKAELEKKWKEYDSKASGDPYYRGMADGLDVFEQFLDTLKESSSVSGTIKRGVGDFSIMKFSLDWWKKLEEFSNGDEVDITVIKKQPGI